MLAYHTIYNSIIEIAVFDGFTKNMYGRYWVNTLKITIASFLSHVHMCSWVEHLAYLFVCLLFTLHRPFLSCGLGQVR